MPALANLVVLVAMLGLLVYELGWARRTGHWTAFALEALAFAGFALLLHEQFGFPFPAASAQAKGPQDDISLTIVLFAFMLLGMLAQAIHQHFSVPSATRIRRKFDWGPIIAPMCASPIIFIPLMVTLQNANLDLRAMTAPKMMIFCVAFQNGFFWKEHYDGKRKNIKSGKE